MYEFTVTTLTSGRLLQDLNYIYICIYMRNECMAVVDWRYVSLRLQAHYVRLKPAHLGAGSDSGWVRSRQEDAVVHGRLHGIS